MRTEFKREMNRNYMVLHPETEMNETYSLRMLSENRITGLLPFREKRVDGESYLYFNITSWSTAFLQRKRSGRSWKICSWQWHL